MFFLKRKNTKNAFFSILEVLIAPILMVAFTPVFINNLGINDYAIWVLVNSIVSSLALFNFAGTDVVIRYVALARNEGEEARVASVFSTVCMLQLMIALSLILVMFLSYSYIFEYMPKNVQSNFEIMFFAIPIFFIKQFEQLIYGFFKGYEEYEHVAYLSSFSKIIFLAGQALVAYLTGSVYEVFRFAFHSSLVIIVIEILYVKKVHRNIIFISSASFGELKRIITYGGWNWLSSMVSIMTVHSDKWIVSSVLGLTVFGYYSIGILIFNQLHNIFAASVGWMFPKISNEGHDQEDFHSNYCFATSVFTLASLVVSLLISKFDFVFLVWLGSEAYGESKAYIDLLIIIFPIYTLHLVSYYHLLALGMIKGKFFIDVLVFLIKILLIYISIVVFNVELWILSFVVFSCVRFVLYTKILSVYLKKSISFLLFLMIAQLIVVLFRVFIYI